LIGIFQIVGISCYDSASNWIGNFLVYFYLFSRNMYVGTWVIWKKSGNLSKLRIDIQFTLLANLKQFLCQFRKELSSVIILLLKIAEKDGRQKECRMEGQKQI